MNELERISTYSLLCAEAKLYGICVSMGYNHNIHHIEFSGKIVTKILNGSDHENVYLTFSSLDKAGSYLKCLEHVRGMLTDNGSEYVAEAFARP